MEYFFPEKECYETVMVEMNFFDANCIKMALGRWLSLNIIVGSVLVKFPQIVKVLRARSVKGLSFMSSLLELLACAFTCAYNHVNGFPFSTWGESFFMGVQVLVILVLILHFTGQHALMAAFLPFTGVSVWVLLGGVLPSEVLSALQALVIPMMVLSRLSQVVAIYLEGSTGQLSFLTFFLLWMGSGTRVFTTLQETGDVLMLTNFSTMFFINFIIVLQFFYYWNASTAKLEKKQD